MSGASYRLPNNWIIDAVNCCVDSEYAWNVVAPSLDMGWTGCGTMDKDPSRYFRSVRRKYLGLDVNGNPVFKDTNNSSADFNRSCIPSEVELQGTPIDPQGTRCIQLTYDGIVPITTTE